MSTEFLGVSYWISSREEIEQSITDELTGD